jgi:hypothetical protein
MFGKYETAKRGIKYHKTSVYCINKLNREQVCELTWELVLYRNEVLSVKQNRGTRMYPNQDIDISLK